MTVQLRDLTIRYGNHVAVDGVSAFFPGGAVGLLGRNGAGKSSILKALLGLVQPTSGSMQILELPAGASSAEIRRVVGYMPERGTHIPRLNGFETVKLAAELTGLPSVMAARRAHEVLYFVGLDEQRYRPVAGYSTGMKQKIKLAVALVHDPQVLFLDEPTDGLDPAGRRHMLRLIMELVERYGKSIILSSHILSDVEEVCEHIVLLERGAVLEAGSVRELTRHETRKYHLSLSGDDEHLEAALETFSGHGVCREGPGRFEIVISDNVSTGQVFAAVQEAGGVVRELREHHRSLEEVFSVAVEGANSGDAE